MGNFNDTLMEQLAHDGNGAYAYVDDLDAAYKVFAKDLTGTLQTVALDAKVQVDFNPNVVTSYRLIGYENREISDQDYFDETVDGGEIGSGHAITALYALRLLPTARGEIGTLYLTLEGSQDEGSLRDFCQPVHGRVGLFFRSGRSVLPACRDGFAVRRDPARKPVHPGQHAGCEPAGSADRRGAARGPRRAGVCQPDRPGGPPAALGQNYTGR